MNWTAITSFLFAILICIGIFYLVMNMPNYSYEMPNGAVCEHLTISGFGGTTFQFFGCTDNQTYINPDHYRKFKVEDKGVKNE